MQSNKFDINKLLQSMQLPSTADNGQDGGQLNPFELLNKLMSAQNGRMDERCDANLQEMGMLQQNYDMSQCDTVLQEMGIGPTQGFLEEIQKQESQRKNNNKKKYKK